jgi:hypothetical protein
LRREEKRRKKEMDVDIFYIMGRRRKIKRRRGSSVVK